MHNRDDVQSSNWFHILLFRLILLFQLVSTLICASFVIDTQVIEDLLEKCLCIKIRKWSKALATKNLSCALYEKLCFKLSNRRAQHHRRRLTTGWSVSSTSCFRAQLGRRSKSLKTIASNSCLSLRILFPSGALTLLLIGFLFFLLSCKHKIQIQSLVCKSWCWQQKAIPLNAITKRNTAYSISAITMHKRKSPVPFHWLLLAKHQ